MKTNIKNVNLLVPKWWNPLFWLVVIFAPVVVTILFTIYGAFTGLLIGYEKGLDFTSHKLNRFIAMLP